MIVLAVVAACGHAAPAPTTAPADEAPAPAVRHYTIWLGGAQVGTATEHEQWTPAGVTLWRQERLAFSRGEVPVAVTTTIEIAADAALVPSHVHWTEAGATTRSARARRDARGWTVRERGPGGRVHARPLPDDAIPAELIPLVVRRTGSFDGVVFLPARGFVTGRGRVQPVAPARLSARLALDGDVTVASTIDLAPDGAPARIVGGDGVIALRATEADAHAAFARADLIAVTSVPIGGDPEPGTRRLHLVGDLALPALPGQRAAPAPGGFELSLSRALDGGLPPGPPGPDRTADIGALVAEVQRRIAPDLATGTGSAQHVRAAAAGDCTTFALAYAALAEQLAIPTRVVTGFRVDEARLVRHRWTISWTGRRWIAVDAAFGVVPAGGDLVGVAVHRADDAGLIAGEAALTRIRGATWR